MRGWLTIITSCIALCITSASLIGCSIEGTRQLGDTCLAQRECASTLRCEVTSDGNSHCVAPVYLDVVLSEASADVDSRDVTQTGPDTGSVDTGSADTGSVDTGSADTGSVDTGSVDTGSVDAGSADVHEIDASTKDAVSVD